MRDSKLEEAENRRAQRLGEFIEALGKGPGVEGLRDGQLTEIRIRFPTEAEPSTLLIVKASEGANKWISFIGAFSAADALFAWRTRCLQGGMRWREDRPWEARGQ